jgi:tRNA pseudouridine55 synthase
MIRWVRHAAEGVRVGHAGTLDPLASGLLILLFGTATKRQSEIMAHPKTYRCVMRCGVRTDTGDRLGQVIEEKPVPSLNESRVCALLNDFVGLIQQIPPMYAAIKKNGVPLYKLARKGLIVDRRLRTVTIHKISLLRNEGHDIEFRAVCSSGTYMRALAEDIAMKLGTVATVAELEREAAGPYTLSHSISGDDLKSIRSEELWQKVVS